MTGTLDTILLSYFLTSDLKIALSIGITEIFTKIFLYYLHERLWNKLQWERKQAQISRLQSLYKSISWRITGTLDTIFIAWIFSGEMVKAISLGGMETITKIALYYLHERIWSRINWGQEFGVEQEFSHLNSMEK